jgi:hypothetical protein
MKIKKSIATAVALALSASGAHALTITIAEYATEALFYDAFSTKTIGPNWVVEDFEDAATLNDLGVDPDPDPLTGTLKGNLESSLVGTFSSLGGIGSGTTCTSNNTAAGSPGPNCTTLARTQGSKNGQGNLVPDNGAWSLNSNDTYGIQWDAVLADNVAFTDLVFGIQDPNDQGARVVVDVDGKEQEKLLNKESNADPFLVHVSFSEAVTSAVIKIFDEDTVNDAISLDGASINAVPLPAAAWLFGSALIGAGVIGRRKKQQV